MCKNIMYSSQLGACSIPFLLGRVDQVRHVQHIHISNIGQYVMAYVVGILCKQDIQEMCDQTSNPVHILDVYYEHNGLV
jgi:hypothetical protein